MRKLLTLLLWLSAGMAFAAGPGLIRLPPWFSDGAVIPPAEPAEFFQSGAPVFSGWATDPKGLRARLSLWPDETFAIDPNEALGVADGIRAWGLFTRHFSASRHERLTNGQTFGVTFGVPARGKSWAGSLTRTNVAVGPVWLLAIKPSHDSHELPALSSAARTRVRVLWLEGDSWARAQGSWQTGAEAERQGLRGFGGLPRAFANALVAQSSDDHQLVGLVLCSPELLKFGDVQGTDLERSTFSLGVPELPALKPGLAAAHAANTAPGFGAVERYRRAKRDYLAQLTELKREGIPGEPFPAAPWTWRRFQAGESRQVPFRVTGVLW